MQNLIEFKGVDLSYEKTTVLRGVNCAVQKGSSVGIVGPNGSGKTTFLKGVLGSLKPAQGKIQVDHLYHFAYVPQVENLNLSWPITVKETVFLPAQSKSFLGIASSEDERLAENAMEKVGVADIGDRLLREVSGGQRQKTILAQALSQKPDVLLLDEPTRGLDVVAERDLLNLILRLKEQENLTILFVTHTLQIALNFMEKILLFDNGAVIETTPSELLKTQKLEEIYKTPFIHIEKDGLKWAAPAPQ